MKTATCKLLLILNLFPLTAFGQTDVDARQASQAGIATAGIDQRRTAVVKDFKIERARSYGIKDIAIEALKKLSSGNQ